MRPRLLLIGSGVALISVSVLARVNALRSTTSPSVPGSLKATAELLQWRCPDPAAGSRPEASLPTFVVANVGGTPVRILAVKTSCGCASAQAEPRVVPPGGRTSVAVRMELLEVGVRAAVITLETDAPSTPVVQLQIVEEGYRRPPYLLSCAGDLFYQEGSDLGEPHNVHVEIVELRGVPERKPSPTSTLPCLRIEPPVVTERKHFNDPDLVVRNYRFPVLVTEEPPVGGFTGLVIVPDPYVSGREVRLKILGEANRPIRVAPSRLILDPAEGGKVRLLARSHWDKLPLTAAPEGADSPLIVEAVGADDETGFRAFEVRWKPGRDVAEGVYNVTVRLESGGRASVTVPVMVRAREG